MSPKLAELLRRGDVRFLLRFALAVCGLLGVFQLWQTPFAWGYLYPISWVATQLLHLLGVTAILDASGTAAGLCTLEVTHHVFGVEFECTGLFSLFAYLGAVLAYPTPARQRLLGVLLGIPAFVAYSALRLVVLGFIDSQVPAWVGWFHIYLMVLLNLGFFLFLWALWVQRSAEPARARM